MPELERPKCSQQRDFGGDRFRRWKEDQAERAGGAQSALNNRANVVANDNANRPVSEKIAA